MTTNSNTKGTAMKLGVITLAIMNVAVAYRQKPFMG